MKTINTYKLVSNATAELVRYEMLIKSAKTFDDAMKSANGMVGFVHGMGILINSMISPENNEFTGEFDETLDGWAFKMYQALVNKAMETKQPVEMLEKLFQKRDQHMMV